MLLDILIKSRVTPLLPGKPLLLGQGTHTIPTRSLHHLAGNNHAGITHALNARVDQTLVHLLGVQGPGKGSSRGVDHVVGDTGGLGEDGAEADAREDIDVVALVGVVGDGLVAAELDGELRKGRARGKDDGAISPGDGLLESALGLGEGVAEREENGSAAETTGVHRSLEGADDRLGEDAKGGSQANKSGWLDVLDNLLK